MGGHMLARKIMRTSYFWLTMETDCCQFVQRCLECQIHGDLIHVSPRMWGIDIIGKISPKFSSGHEFILVAIDYFTKAKVDTLVQRYGIQHHRSSAYRPQTNEAVEAANKNIKRILQKMQIPEADWAQAQLDQLNLLDERRLRAVDHVIRGLIRDPRGKFRPNWSGPYFIKELTLEGAAWLMDLDGNRFLESTNMDQLKRYYLWVIVPSIITFIADVTSLHVGFERIITPLCTLCFTIILILLLIHHLRFTPCSYLTTICFSFPSFMSPYHPSLHYVSCLKTILRPWDQMSSSTAPTWTRDASLMFRSVFSVDLDYWDRTFDDG
ncbi:hypothetical protein AAG906_026196 [Vitis piasezkii]